MGLCMDGTMGLGLVEYVAVIELMELSCMSSNIQLAVMFASVYRLLCCYGGPKP